ncbi:hypothetical protein M9H77_22535 [Catharanthus roseus]|uniref:Uncharacterized protein n=1 Tax=Catharanthus roseus TaxID=4058 RepID=A0ACC0ATA4_CATRO|nr:hypothetical protein M9H77_22535 [Catharanthus roseus]
MPFKYLGIPLLEVYLKVPDYAPLLDRVTKTLVTWARRNLSYVGRLEVIFSVVQVFYKSRQQSWIGSPVYAGDSFGATATPRLFGMFMGRKTDFGASGYTISTSNDGLYGTLQLKRIIHWAEADLFQVSLVQLRPTEVPVFMWLAVLGRILMMDKLLFLKMDTFCGLYKQQEESISHLFFACVFTTDIWKSIRD